MGVIGPFIRLEERDGELLAEIGEHIIVLPIKLKDVLTPLLSHRIAVLATDIVGKEYLVRELPDEKPRSSHILERDRSWFFAGDRFNDGRFFVKKSRY